MILKPYFCPLLVLFLPRVLCFSRGAPTSVCTGAMEPRHGYDPQTGRAPVEIMLDQLAISHKEYLRVTIRSSQAFRGFVVKAVDKNCKELFLTCLFLLFGEIGHSNSNGCYLLFTSWSMSVWEQIKFMLTVKINTKLNKVKDTEYILCLHFFILTTLTNKPRCYDVQLGNFSLLKLFSNIFLRDFFERFFF